MLKWRKQDIETAIEGSDDTEHRFAHQGATLNNMQQSGDYVFLGGMSDWYVRPAMILTSFALFCGLLYSAGQALWNILDKPIDQLTLTGETQYLKKQNFIDDLILDVRKSNNSVGVLSSNIKEIQQLAVEDPWINSAKIKRSWPPAIAIEIQEQVPVAKWGKKGLLNHQGDIFWPGEDPLLDSLPLLDGPSTDTARVMDQYHTLSQFFKGSDSYMKGLSLQARGAWILLLNNEIKVELGRDKVLARLRRFLELYKGHLYLKAQNIERVDVRYTNGVAVKWKRGYLQSLQEPNKK